MMLQLLKHTELFHISPPSLFFFFSSRSHPQAMSVNSSSSLNVTFVPPPSSLYEQCQHSLASIVIYTMYTFFSVLLLPLYIFILYIGFQQWRYQRSGPSGQTMSHSDVFTFHLIIVETFGVFGTLIYTLGTFTNSMTVLMLGVFAFCIIFPGQTLFHLLTCVERYLAVVHPVPYIHLRETGGVRIRSISIGCVWLLCFGWLGVTILYLPHFPVIPFLCLMSVSIIVVFFCCLSVLRVLTQPGPGMMGKVTERVDQSKQRAFHIIIAITGALLLRLVGLLVSFSFYNMPSIRIEDLCALLDFGILLTLPCSLVLPLLFLHKTGKLACCRNNTESG